MRENKIERKIKRLELLNNLLYILNQNIEDIQGNMKNDEERLERYREEGEEFYIDAYTNNIANYKMKIEEAEKLISDLEKMI